MIKFRCPACGQKIAVNDEGVGVVIACTCCTENIVVPSETDVEFRASTSPVRTIETELLDPVSRPAADRRAEQAMAIVRAGLVPHLARWMTDRLVHGLATQRAQLIASQHAAAERVVELERRLTKLQKNVWCRLGAYEKRIAELQQELAIKEEENRALLAAQSRHVQRTMEGKSARSEPTASLTDPRLLLRV